ncbi:MAG: hypothetical protein ACRCV9_03085 [Burkholderiaceae bacterium]
MIPYLIAAGVVVAAIGAGVWKYGDDKYDAGGAAKELKLNADFAVERSEWAKTAAAAASAQASQREANAATASAVNAKHNTELAEFRRIAKGQSREIDRLSDNLAACQLAPDLVRLLNDQGRAATGGHRKD